MFKTSTISQQLVGHVSKTNKQTNKHAFRLWLVWQHIHMSFYILCMYIFVWKLPPIFWLSEFSSQFLSKLQLRYHLFMFGYLWNEFWSLMSHGKTFRIERIIFGTSAQYIYNFTIYIFLFKYPYLCQIFIEIRICIWILFGLPNHLTEFI